MCSRAATHFRPSATWSSKRRERVLRMEAVSPLPLLKPVSERVRGRCGGGRMVVGDTGEVSEMCRRERARVRGTVRSGCVISVSGGVAVGAE
jgi:hypothetical protein